MYCEVQYIFWSIINAKNLGYGKKYLYLATILLPDKFLCATQGDQAKKY